ncbi:MAG: hypothetical protein IPL41_01410 [Micropruina sp.]|nr:hypothetical protein [Micropruina sp.]
MAGDKTALADADSILSREIENQNELYRQSIDINGDANTQYQANATQLSEYRTGLSKTNAATAEAAEQQRLATEADKGRTEQLAEAKRSQDSFNDSLKEGASTLDDYASTILKDSKINFKEWKKRQQTEARNNKLILKFDADAELSPAARENFRKLPRESQAIVAKEWSKGGKRREKVEVFLNADAKVSTDNTTVDNSGAQAQANKNPVTVPTTVTPPTNAAAVSNQAQGQINKTPIKLPTDMDAAGVLKAIPGVQNRAQAQASKEGNKIKFGTKLNDSGLQGEVNRAAAAINPPTIWVKVKARKDVP